MIKPYPLNTSEEYTNFVRSYVTLLDKQLTILEGYLGERAKLTNLISLLIPIISLVNTVGYLRGQDGIFTDIRPATSNQNEFYQYEDLFEKRLRKIIDYIMNSEMKEYYLTELKRYYIEART